MAHGERDEHERTRDDVELEQRSGGVLVAVAEQPAELVGDAEDTDEGEECCAGAGADVDQPRRQPRVTGTGDRVSYHGADEGHGCMRSGMDR